VNYGDMQSSYHGKDNMRTGENAHSGIVNPAIGPRTGLSRHASGFGPYDTAAFNRPAGRPNFNGAPRSAASEHVDDDQDLPPDKTYVCRICGNTIVGCPPAQCPICGAPREEFDVTK